MEKRHWDQPSTPQGKLGFTGERQRDEPGPCTKPKENVEGRGGDSCLKERSRICILKVEDEEADQMSRMGDSP